MAKSSVFMQCLWCLWLLWMRDYSCFEKSSTHFHSHLHKTICAGCLFKYCWVKLRILFPKPGQENPAWKTQTFSTEGQDCNLQSLRRVPHLQLNWHSFLSKNKCSWPQYLLGVIHLIFYSERSFIFTHNENRKLIFF